MPRTKIRIFFVVLLIYVFLSSISAFASVHAYRVQQQEHGQKINTEFLLLNIDYFNTSVIKKNMVECFL